MPGLTAELRKEHIALAEMLKAVKMCGVETIEGQEKVFSMKELLIAHLRKEDLQLYPAMKVASSYDERLAYTLELFAKDMDAVTAFVIKFYNRPMRFNPDAGFCAEVKRFLAIIRSRMSREETTLYSEYDKLCL